MSYTQEQTLYAAVHENGLNDLFKAFFGVRGHYLEYSTPAYTQGLTPAMATAMPPIILNLSGFFQLDIEYLIKFSIPMVDIVPAPITGILDPGSNQFRIKSGVKLEMMINTIQLFSVTVDVFGKCEPVVVSSTPGTGSIGIKLKQIEIVDLPPPFEDIAELILFPILKFALAAAHIPFNTMTVGAFVFQLLQGPLADQNLLKVRGNVV
jgi:hypothetical protein